MSTTNHLIRHEMHSQEGFLGVNVFEDKNVSRHPLLALQNTRTFAGIFVLLASTPLTVMGSAEPRFWSTKIYCPKY